MLPEQYAHTGQKYKETEKKLKCEEPLLWYMYLIIIYIFYIPGKYICMKKSFYADVAMTIDLEFY